MGAREDFDKAVRNGDFAAAALAWTVGPLERTEGVEMFESKLQASLEDRTVTIGQTLQLSGGEYEYLGNSGQDGARLAYIPKDASLDRMEFIRDAAQLQEHMQRLEMQLADRDAVVAFFAMSERATLELQQSEVLDLAGKDAEVTAPAPNAERLSTADSLRALLSSKTADAQVTAAAMSAAQGLAVNDRLYAGSLLAHGAAPYMHDVDNPPNYFVTLKTPSGHEETIWGKELAAAIDNAKAEPGADIVLAYQGSKQVMVPVKERDGSGKLTGKTIEASATRNNWLIRSIDDLLAAATQEQAVESEALAEVLPTEEVTVDLPTSEVLSETVLPEAAPEQPVPEEQEAEAAMESEPEDSIQPATTGRGGEVTNAIARAHRNADDAIMQAKGKSAGGAGLGEAEHDAPAGPKTLLNGRFILRDRGEYFRVADGVTSTRVALVDEVNKIRFVDKQMDTFQAALELAKHKQWEAILVTGSEKFRAEAWHHARMAGLEVVGYEPTAQDLATLKAAQGKGPQTPVMPDGRTDDDRANDASLAALHDRIIKEGYGAHPAQTENGRHVGKILFESDKHFAQDTGRKVATVHEKQSFPPAALKEAVEKGDVVKLQYKSGQGVIEAAKDRAKDRGR
ncbi:LPD7 domain-containing protein [Agrobacterium tumefaciens]|uniref:LPD7 domain-containing protein n=1 Tax=Agrobacterium tumefaciens TaxID=358 RepID=UPI0015736801|nr:LPD7 domain-containing protein [Agrobacterium tumefaciens]NTB05908.1 hypothetical protein [Agrobacterium tumefaciens]